MTYYIWIIVIALFYCLLVASYKYYFMKAQSTVFFYHELLIPFRQHAIQVSIYLFAALIYLLEQTKKGVYLHNKHINFLLIIYFTCCILLLSSKLVIAFTACCFIYYFFLIVKSKPKARYIIFTSLIAGTSMIVLVLSTQNKVSKRFYEIMSSDMHLVHQQNFTPSIYFNGLQFRLLQLRFVNEILSEHNAWLTGVSDNAQLLLDKKYISTGMYIGDGITADRGYLGYNTHNEFLESLLQSGLIGLIAFILICSSLVLLAVRRQNRELTIIVILLIAYCFNESVFDTQYGITLFTFFPLFLYYGTKKRTKPGFS